MNMINKIEEIISECFSGSDKFLVDVSVKPGNRIAVFIDGERGITIEDCRDLTRFIESKLDRDEEDYELTVSSTGADSPMKIPRQFLKHVGRQLEVITTGGATIKGKLVNTDADAIELEHIQGKKEKKQSNTLLKFNEIKQGKVVLAFK